MDALLQLEYAALEVFVVDNGSVDQSPSIIKDWLKKNKHTIDIKAVFREKSLPYCQSFNAIFSQIKGKYFIDLSGDDILLPEHLKRSVETLEKFPKAAVCFSDAYLISRAKKKTFYPRNQKGQLVSKVQDGDLYKTLVARHHVLSVTMLIRSEYFGQEGGYDESLSYEDFDIQVRLSRKYPFVFSDHFGVEKRMHHKAYSASQYKRYDSEMLFSTLKVCQKIKVLNQDEYENQALKQRVLFELKHALFSANFEVAEGFVNLLQSLKTGNLKYWLYRQWAKHQWDFSGWYVFLKKLR